MPQRHDWIHSLAGIVMAGLIAGSPLSVQAQAQPLPSVDVGRIERLTRFESRFVDARPIDVWLPPGYSADRRYAVLYMHDGQGLFDARIAWNRAAWNVHLALNRLVQTGAVQDTIVVAIPNNGTYRYSEYFPEKFLPLLPDAVRQDYVTRAQQGRPLADAYLRFIVEELKPAIDSRFATRKEAAGTFIMGSSMGGLISLYALCEYPQVFGGAAALSTHWLGRPSHWGPPEKLQNASLPLAAYNYLQRSLPAPGAHRFYMDHGTLGLDAAYGPYQVFVDGIFLEKGYTPASWQSRVFEGQGHTETDWSARVDIPLVFLLGKR